MRQIHYITAIRYVVYLLAVFFYGAALVIGWSAQWIDNLLLAIAPTEQAKPFIDGLSRQITTVTYVILVIAVFAVTFLFLLVLKYLNLASERYLLRQDIDIQAQLSRLYEITKADTVSLPQASSPRPQPVLGPKEPKLVRSTFSTVGMKSEAQQLGFDAPTAFALFLQNEEQRFETHAHNLHASMILKFAGGKEVKVDEAPWFKNTGGGSSFYHQSVTIGMLDSAGVVCVIRSGRKFYTALYCDSEKVKSGIELAYGQWELTIKVEGDNLTGEYSAQLQLLPNGSVGLTPLDK